MVIRPPSPPHIDKINGVPVEVGGKPPVVRAGPYAVVAMEGHGFLEFNALWVGPYDKFVESLDGSTLVPRHRLADRPGTDQVFVVNRHGKSNVVTVVVSKAL